MQTELKEIFYETIERAEVEKSKTFCRLSDKLDKIYEELDENQKKVFDEIYNLYNGMMAEEDFSHFKLGFKLGLTLAMEAFFN